MNPLKNEKLEDAIIGTLLQLDEVRPVILPVLSVDSFTQNDTRTIFGAIQALAAKDTKVDLLSVENYLKEHKGWSDAQAANLVHFEAIYSDAESKANTLNDKKTKRGLSKELRTILNDLTTKPGTATDTITKLENLCSDKVRDASIAGLEMQEIEDRDKNQPKFEQLYTGDKFFDHTFYANAGSRKGQYEVIIGRPKHGKTHEAIRRAVLYAQQGYKVVYFTMESSDREIYSKFRIYFGENNPNIKIVDKSGVSTLSELIQCTKYWKAAWRADMCVVDYLQRLPVQDIPYHDETHRIVTCSNYLSDMAVRENIFCLALAQPSNPDRRTRKGYSMEPEVWDIYGSGAILKDAFLVSSIFRPSEIEELCFFNKQGNVRGVQAPGSKNEADMLHRNTVFLRQKIIRNGEKYMPYIMLKHTDKGLVRAAAMPKKTSKKEHQTPF